MAKSKRKLSDINNEYKKQNESYRQTIKEQNEVINFWVRSYSSLTYKYKDFCEDKVPELYASFILGFIFGMVILFILNLVEVFKWLK